MSDVLQQAKRVVLDYYEALDAASPEEVVEVLRKHTTDDYTWRGVHPFHERAGVEAVAETFWIPTKLAFTAIQRRPDVFLAGASVTPGTDSHAGVEADEDVGVEAVGESNGVPVDGQGPEAVWVCQMGHLLGLFDTPWLDIPPTGKMCFLRYAEFHRVDGGQIAETALFTDVISVMSQAGHYPLPPQTGSSHIHPGPRTHDGLLLEPQDESKGRVTMDLVHRMIDDLTEANEIANRNGEDRVPRSVLADTWHEDMIWSGPEGIGATYTIDRYQQQHQYPFRFNLANKVFNGHVARFAEGEYACFFGWANLTNTAVGGFLGMTGGDTPAEMRVVDVYRRDGDKLAENWVFIDLLHWLDMQGLDVLARMRQLLGLEQL